MQQQPSLITVPVMYGQPAYVCPQGFTPVPPGQVGDYPPPPQVAMGIPMATYQQGPGGQFIQPHYTFATRDATVLEDPSHFTFALIFSGCFGIWGLCGLCCFPTKHYQYGFLSGFGLWLAIVGLYILIVNSLRVPVFLTGLIFGVVMIVCGVPTSVLGFYRKRELDQAYMNGMQAPMHAPMLMA